MNTDVQIPAGDKATKEAVASGSADYYIQGRMAYRLLCMQHHLQSDESGYNVPD
jgi:hypothetical protein